MSADGADPSGASPPAPGGAPRATDPKRRSLVECLAAFAAVTLLAAALFQVARAVPFVAHNLAAFVALGFIYAPVWSARRRGQDLTGYGFTTSPHRRTIAFALVWPAVVFPLFLIGFISYYRIVCSTPALAALAPAAWCRGFIGWSGLLEPRLPPDLAWTALSQVVVVALPEELFFRGYLLALLEDVWPPRRRLLGGGVGLALVVSAVLFALGHLAVGFHPLRLATFFPGLLFGWLRSATGNIAAGTVVHAGANLYMEALHRTFFR